MLSSIVVNTVSAMKITRFGMVPVTGEQSNDEN